MPGKKTIRLAATILLFALCAPPVCAAGISVRDDTGATITLSTSARRIVSLSPHATELLFAAGAGARVVGVSLYSDWPAAARSLPKVGGYAALDLERIVRLKPDLVVGWASGNTAGQIAQLRALGIPVFLSEPKALEDIARNLEVLGQLGGSAPAAQEAAARFRTRVAALSQRYAQRAPVRIFYQIWTDPLMTLNGEHLVSKVLALCGGENVFADQGALAPTVTEEAVLRAAPGAILSPSEPGVPSGALERWKRWRSLPAVRADNLIPVDGNLLNRSGPRIVEGAEAVCARLDEARERLHGAQAETRTSRPRRRE